MNAYLEKLRALKEEVAGVEGILNLANKNVEEHISVARQLAYALKRKFSAPKIPQEYAKFRLDIEIRFIKRNKQDFVECYFRQYTCNCEECCAEGYVYLYPTSLLCRDNPTSVDDLNRGVWIGDAIEKDGDA